MIEQSKISEIVNKIADGYNPDKIIIFGSYAVGNADENSDLDILVIKQSDLPRPQRTHQLRKMLLGSMFPMDLIVFTPEEIERAKDDKYGFVFQVLTTGKTIYERPS